MRNTNMRLNRKRSSFFMTAPYDSRDFLYYNVYYNVFLYGLERLFLPEEKKSYFLRKSMHIFKNHYCNIMHR